MKTTSTTLSRIAPSNRSQNRFSTLFTGRTGRAARTVTRRSLRGIASLLLGGAALALSSGAFANTFFVATNGSDNFPGSAAAPLQSLRQAIAKAQTGDTILVAPGTYSGPNNTDLNFAGKNLLLESQQGPQSCIIDGGGTSIAFVFQSGEQGGAGVVGFTIQNTYNNGSVWQEGGAMLISGSNPTIENCIFKSCSVSNITGGGALFISGGSPLISSCMFEGCSANGGNAYGGAICIDGSANTVIENCTFHGNTAGWWGGAIYSQGGNSLQISQCAFRENSSQESGGALYFYGVPNASVTKSSFLGNTAVSLGGAIFDQQQGAIQISSSSFVGNHSQEGGALCFLSPSVLLLNSSIIDNVADYWGSGVFSYGNSVSIINSIVYGNRIPGRAADQLNNDNGYSSITANYSDIEGGYAGVGNINSDPNFVQNPGATNAPYGDLHLQSASPCLDMGTAANVTLPYFDLDDLPRVYGAAPDMGAYEMQPASSFSYSKYRIINISNGMTLQGPAWIGGQVTQAGWSGAASQEWTITPAVGHSGLYVITNQATGLVLESLGWGTQNGNIVDTWSWNGGSNQLWSLSFQGIDYYKLINSNTNLLLEDPASSILAGTGMDEWADQEGANLNQQWALVRVQ